LPYPCLQILFISRCTAICDNSIPYSQKIYKPMSKFDQMRQTKYFIFLGNPLQLELIKIIIKLNLYGYRIFNHLQGENCMNIYRLSSAAERAAAVLIR